MSFPGPVPPITAKILAENKRIVARDYRNRRVGDFLKELNLTEGRGTVIPNIKRSLDRNQSPEPVFETDDQCLYFLTVLPANPEFILDQVSDNDNDHDRDNDRNQVSNQASNQVSNQVRQILSFCLISKSRAEIMEFLGISNQSKNYKRHIETLLAKGWLEFTHPERPRHRNQKYITTPKGKKVFENAIR
ncbi:Fic family protein [Aquiflexum sp.]|uniref:Fic family protein n=1 Tax=Aquiflexum sp. TaxID=1872584 RepID=UPI003593896A